MVVDYTKWDALELSDDSDIEVHPNVDKRSFIRGKQGQIHMERQQRKRLIQALKHERVINDALMQRLRVLTSALQSRQSNLNPADIAFQALMELASAKPEEDSPPPRPEGVFDADLPPLPTYSKMLVTVLDEVNNTLDERRTDKSHRYQAFAQELGVHVQKVQDLQAELVKELDTLEQQDSKKITSESYHAGFDSSYVNNTKPAETSKQETKIDVELLNPNHTLDETTLNAQTGKQTRTAADNSGVSEPTKIRASPAAMRFAEIPASDSRASRDHLSSHPKLLQQESETVGLLIEAYYALMLDQPDEKRARQYVHQALLLQYCRMLGRDGLQLVFKRITTPGHQARELFEKDVAERFQTIRSMAKRDSRETDEGVEQVQLYPAGENSSIRIQVPPVESEGEEARKAREIFEQFSPEMRAALERGLLEEVNNVSEFSSPLYFLFALQMSVNCQFNAECIA